MVRNSKSVRPPIVTIMGHVDHGKTTLLDTLRKSRITEKEAGGITQHIGAYQISHHEQKITFIDTPGHAAFTKMRSRGAQITDLVILVVAATEGVKPQTIESINHIKRANVPFIVALNKIDLPEANPIIAKSELAQHEVYVEGFGGQVPIVEISAKTGKNLDSLLDLVLLMAEMTPPQGSQNDSLEAVVIESRLDKNLGTSATVLVKKGVLNSKDSVYLFNEKIKLRTLKDDLGRPVAQALPGMPVEISGFKSLPVVGDVLTQSPEEPARTESIQPAESKPEPLDEFEEEKKPVNIPVIIKADVQGSLEAIKSNLSEEVIIVGEGIGQVNESDVLLASTTGARIIAFGVSVSPSVKQMAENEKVKIKSYRVIYDLLEEMEKLILKLLEPTIDEKELGKAEVLALFEIKGDRIAGCKVVSGEISRSDNFHLIREGKTIADVKLRSLKQAKEDVSKVKSPHECGLVISSALSLKPEDQLVAFKKSEETL